MSKFITPKGTAVYPKLIRPDTKFNADGVYKTGLNMSKEAAGELLEMYKDIFIEAHGKAKMSKANFPYQEQEDGTVTLGFKSKNQPKFFDSKGQPILDVEDLNIGGGSVLRVRGTAKAYSAGGALGVSAYVNSVQIINLTEYNGGGFDADDEGDYVAEKPKAAPETTEEDTGDLDF